MIQSKYTTWILLPLWISFIALMTWFGYTRGQTLALGLVFSIPVAIFFVNNPKLNLMVCIILFNSGLRVPGIWFDVNCFQLATSLYVAMAVLRYTITKKGISFRGLLHISLLLFTLNIFMVMFFRGAGFRLFGDENWGGMRYVTVLITIAFFFTIKSVQLSERQWVRTFYLYLIISTLPFLAEATYVLSNGAIYHHYFLFEFARNSNASLNTFITGSGGLIRFQSALTGGVTLVYLGLLLTAIYKKYWILCLPVIFTGLLLVGLSGHRIGLIRSVMVSIIFLYIYHKNSRKKIAFNYIFSSVIIIVSAYLFAQYLPKNFQRTLAFLPGINIDSTVAFDAMSTSNWRINVWKFALDEIPQYIWVGKGYTYPAFIEYLIALQQRSGIWNQEIWAINTVAYHNGFFSLIIGLGLSGLILGVLLMSAIFYRYFRPLQMEWVNKKLKIFYILFYSISIVNILFFFTIYGDFQVSIPIIMFQTSLLEALREYHLRSCNRPAETSFSANTKPILPQKNVLSSIHS